MRKEIRKMYLYAIIKIVCSILGYGLVLFVCIGIDDLAAGITCGILFAIPALIYLVSGIFQFKNGEKHVREYIKTSGYSRSQLERECDTAKDFGRARVGDTHLFANASVGFYVVPLDRIQEVWVAHYGENRLKGREGYYYLHVKFENRTIDVYYLLGSSAEKAKAYIQEQMNRIR